MAAFTVPQFQIPESPFKDLVKDALNSYYATKYQFPQAAENLRKSQIENQYLPEREKYAVDLAKVQPDYIRAHMQLFSAQAQKAQQEAEQANMVRNFIRQRLGVSGAGSEGSPIAMQQPTGYTIDRSGRTVPEPIPTYGYQTTFGKEPSVNQSLLQSPETERLPSTNLPTPELTYMQPPEINRIGAGLALPAEVPSHISSILSGQPLPMTQIAPSSNRALESETILSSLMGLGKNQVIDVNGEKYIMTGTGKMFPSGLKGLSEQEKAKLDTEQKEILKDFEDSTKAQADLPVLQNMLKSALRAQEITNTKPQFFGHWMKGIKIPFLDVRTPSGAEWFESHVTDPEAGELTGRLVPQIASLEKQLSEKGNQLALKVSAGKMPQWENSHEFAKGKMTALVQLIRDQIEKTKILAGNTYKIGNKRYKKIRNKVYEIGRNE